MQAIASLRTFDPGRGSARAWLFGSARRVYAQHCEQAANGHRAIAAVAGRRQLDDDEIEELAAKIDDQRAGRELLARFERVPSLERAALELVDLAGLTPREAASALDVSPGALRARLFRARNLKGTAVSSFEDQLWSELVREQGDQIGAHPRATATLAASAVAPRSRAARAARGRRARRPALVTGTALGTAGLATAVVLALSATTSAPAFAVTGNADGTVTVTLNDISAIAAVNAELARDGIPARAVPMTATRPTHAPLVYMPAGTNPSTYTITIVPREIPAGYTGVLAASQTASGRVELLMGAVLPPAPACFSSTPTVLHPIDPAHVSPALRAAIAKARAAVAAARR